MSGTLGGGGPRSLERLCKPDSIRVGTGADGLQRLAAHFSHGGFSPHRHVTYGIGVTTAGVQTFRYRGAQRICLPGQMHVLHPDEMHDGLAATSAGFGYRIVYVEPSQLADAIQVLRGRPAPLPFVDPVSSNSQLRHAIEEAFRTPLESLAVDSLVVNLAEGLVAGERGAARAPRRIDVRALERARQFLDAEKTRVVRSTEIESITGLTRYDLSRQFKIMFGTSPYRYLLMRRLDFARERIQRDRPLVEVACDAGFADQAHFTRTFRSAFGLTPARYRALLRTGRTRQPRGESIPPGL